MSAVATAIKDLFLDPIEIEGMMANELRFGEANFVFYNEWGGPCIISNCQTGDRCLQQLHQHLTRALRFGP